MIFDLPGRESLQRVPTIEPLRGSREHVGRSASTAATPPSSCSQRSRRSQPAICDRVGAWQQEQTAARQQGLARPRRRPEVAPDEAVAERKEQLDEDVDAILDEIDDVLEYNAEDFVQSFVQKGGE